MKKRILLGLLVACMVMTQLSFTSHADELDETISQMQEKEQQTQETISNLEKQTKETKDAIDALKGQKAETQNNVTSLESQSSQLQSTINGYSDKLDSLNEEIAVAEEAMAEVSSEIVDLNGQLQEAKNQEKERYELLKKRLKSTYESGGTSGFVRILLGSGSFQDFLTKYEYLNAIIRYDRQKIAEIQEIQRQIEEKTMEVEEKEKELDEYQAGLDEKHDELSELTDTVMGKLSNTRNSLSSEKNKLADYDNQLAALDEKMKKLESQTAAAQAELAKQIAERLALTKEDTSGSYSASDTELAWLAATIQAEADGESYTGKLAVGSVIMNRVKSSAFPGTVIGVITQNMQFASYRSGKVELIVSNGPNSTCMRAAQEVLDGARVGDYLFFMTKYYADYYGISEYTMIGNHAFFYRWITNKKEEDTSEDSNNEDTSENSDDSGDSGDGDASENTDSDSESESEDNSDEEDTSEEDGGSEDSDSSDESEDGGDSDGGDDSDGGE